MTTTSAGKSEWNSHFRKTQFFNKICEILLYDNYCLYYFTLTRQHTHTHSLII